MQVLSEAILAVAMIVGAGAVCTLAICLKRIAGYHLGKWWIRRELRRMAREIGYVSDRWVRHESWRH